MRKLITLALLMTLAATVHADGYSRGRHKRQAATALFVIGSAMIVASASLIAIGIGSDCSAGSVDCSTNGLIYSGISLLVVGVAAHGVAMPLYISGSNDIDRWRRASTPVADLATVRF